MHAALERRGGAIDGFLTEILPTSISGRLGIADRALHLKAHQELSLLKQLLAPGTGSAVSS